MSTRAFIGYVVADNPCHCKGVYCHYDGYVTGVGKCLQKHYNSLEAVQAIVELGWCSALKETLERSRFYIRDMEKPVEHYSAIDFPSIQSLETSADGPEGYWWLYIYLFTDNGWRVYSVSDKERKWRTILGQQRRERNLFRKWMGE